ncbi:hypothetical protein ACL9RH_17740 [Chryseobacterium sp. Mn2064]
MKKPEARPASIIRILRLEGLNFKPYSGLSSLKLTKLIIRSPASLH